MDISRSRRQNVPSFCRRHVAIETILWWNIFLSIEWIFSEHQTRRTVNGDKQQRDQWKFSHQMKHLFVDWVNTLPRFVSSIEATLRLLDHLNQFCVTWQSGKRLLRSSKGESESRGSFIWNDRDYFPRSVMVDVTDDPVPNPPPVCTLIIYPYLFITLFIEVKVILMSLWMASTTKQDFEFWEYNPHKLWRF